MVILCIFSLPLLIGRVRQDGRACPRVLPAANRYDNFEKHHTRALEDAIMTPTRIITSIVSATLLASASHAHDYWFERSGEDYLLHRGHRFSEHQGEKEVPFDPAIVTGVRCLRHGSAAPAPAAVSAGYPLRVQGPCLAIQVTADSGYWSQTLTGTRNQGKDELFGVLRSWQALESVKRVEAWTERLREPLSTDLELVFTENPFSLAVGDKVRLAAVLDGEPVAGVTVAYHGDPRGVTGDDGRVNLRIRHQGLQFISASLEQPLDSERADKRVRSTILMFDIQ
jgi:nickel transport protein